MARIAYGKRENVQFAIDSGVIPPDTLIVTKDSVDSELLFYDVEKNLFPITERTRFETLTEAEAWAKTHPCVGLVFSIQNGSEWLPYIVQGDNTLKSFTVGATELPDISIIDGGTSAGI